VYEPKLALAASYVSRALDLGGPLRSTAINSGNNVQLTIRFLQGEASLRH
jgi:hypothetical protein